MQNPRIAGDQPIAAMAKNALMIASQELRLVAYRQPYHLGHAEQRAALLHTLDVELDRVANLPPIQLCAKYVIYLVVAGGEPVLIPEAEVLPWVSGYALAKGGRRAADRVSYRLEMLTWPLDDDVEGTSVP